MLLGLCPLGLMADVPFKPATPYTLTCRYGGEGSVTLGELHGSGVLLLYQQTSQIPEDGYWVFESTGAENTWRIKNAVTGQYLQYSPQRVEGSVKGLVLSSEVVADSTSWQLQGSENRYNIVNVADPQQWLNLRTDGTWLLGTYAHQGMADNELFSFYDQAGAPVEAEGTSLPDDPSAGTMPSLLDSLYVNGKPAVYDQAGNRYPIHTRLDADKLKDAAPQPAFLRLSYPELSPELLAVLYRNPHIVVLLDTDHRNGVGEQRAFFHTLLNAGCKNPVIPCRRYRESDLQSLQVKAACDLGVLFIDGFGDGILIENDGNAVSARDISSLAYGILQATRVRTTKTEYISCPGCGRTLFDLQRAVARVKEKTAHLAGLKIAVMGCIVNGPGEMADADYGYVGAGRGKVSLYKKKTCIERNIPEEEAVDKLLALIEREEGK